MLRFAHYLGLYLSSTGQGTLILGFTSPSSTAKIGESYSLYQLLIKDMNRQRLKRLRLDKNGFPLPLLINKVLEKHQEVPMPRRSRKDEMSLEKFEFV